MTTCQATGMSIFMILFHSQWATVTGFPRACSVLPAAGVGAFFGRRLLPQQPATQRPRHCLEQFTDGGISSQSHERSSHWVFIRQNPGRRHRRASLPEPFQHFLRNHPARFSAGLTANASHAWPTLIGPRRLRVAPKSATTVPMWYPASRSTNSAGMNLRPTNSLPSH